MPGFAEIILIDDLSNIPIKFNLLRKAPGFMLDWYIRRFNPFTAEDTEILGERGYLVTLPLTSDDMRERPEYFSEQAAQTLHNLRDYGVGIVLPPAMPAGALGAAAFPDILPVADGNGVFAFFMMQAIDKTLKLAGKNIKTAEIVLIDGNQSLTQSVLDNIYPHVNYLTLITDEDYSGKCAQIYSDCGLNMSVSDYNRSSLVSADIIINTREENKFDFYYKRGAIYFELGRRNGAETAAKRDDILIVDGLRLSRSIAAPSEREEDITLERFECGLHAMSRDYRKLCSRYDSCGVRPVAERIKTLGYSVRGLMFCGRSLSGPCFDSVFRKS